jgi:hypothetical protein
VLNKECKYYQRFKIKHMKKLVVSLLGLLISVSLSYGQTLASLTTVNTAKSAVINIKHTTHDFGRIGLGTPATAEFTFTNIGDAPLSITSVAPSCGCTVSSYTQEPVLPGKSGFIKATYTAKHVGVFNKSITVTANTADKNLQLFIKGEVVEK